MTMQICIQKTVKNLRKLFPSCHPVITVKSKHLLLLKCLKQKINRKPLKLLMQLMAHTISLKLKFLKAGLIIVGKNRDILSVHKLPCNTICNLLISLEIFLGASMIQGHLDTLHYIRRKTRMKYC